MFIAIDGIDGAGKTTLVRQLADYVGTAGVVTTKEPTDDSEWGRRLRDSARQGRLPRETEIEFFHKDRVQHINGLIKPALNLSKLVICDRYVDSTLAFQAQTPEEADELFERFRSEILVPDITFILDCPVDVGLARIRRDREYFSEFERVEFLEQARTIYASRVGDTYAHLNASGTPTNTFQQAIDVLQKRFPTYFPTRRRSLKSTIRRDSVFAKA